MAMLFSKTCPVCGKAYKHESMAMRCTRTSFCRKYNTPPPKERDCWRIVGGVGYLVSFCSFPVWEQVDHALPLWQLAEDAHQKADKIFQYLFEHHPMAEHARKAIHDDIMRGCAQVWTPNEPVNMCYLCEVLSAVAHDALREAELRAYAPAALGLMRDASAALDTLFEAYEPEKEDLNLFDKVMASIALLELIILGVKSKPRQPALYLVDGWQLVAARGRAEVRRVLHSIGKSRPRTIEGIANGEKFEDGRTAADILRHALVPDIIGRLEI